MNFKIVVMTVALTMMAPLSATEADPPVITIEENLWVAFYDVPSRRFRDIRNAFVRREFDRASKDLETSASYLVIEASRALPAIKERLNEVTNRMTWISEHIDDAKVTAADLDTLFSRSHWLLAQHFLDMARRSRDSGQHRNAGLYLWATTHHLERAVLWSNSRISRDVDKTLEDLRDLADRLQDEKLAAEANRDKPLLRADRLLRKLGKTIDRPVVLPAASPST
ncbi:MAG: hypothetical protein OEM50_01460 [Gammaproteobacteria bacterium]|nr:hypothetical protein [Gammaproteobacteria bacterium]MDH3362204.1 hypothetical protein [Gammaproteobacteria bacterium]MDH3480353.1 hypothetical protein [Gammaproteobacteria bacterium]